MHRRRLVAALLGMAVVVTACGGDRDASNSTTSTTAPQPPLAVQVDGQSYGHRSVPLTGTLSLDSRGCWSIDLEDDVTRLVAFPTGTSRAGDEAVVTPLGEELTGGSIVDGRGGVIPLAGDAADPVWTDYLASCAGDVGELVVLDSLAGGFLPEALTDPELIALAQQAALTEAWPCGVGFAASDDAQHVSLVVHANDPSTPLEVPVVLPDERWTAELLIGKNLMAEWCNDAIEPWVSWPQVIVRWPLVGGTIEFAPPPDGYLYHGARVTATLRGAQVAAPTGLIDLGEMDLVNEHFGVFAG